jgi:hypothetical protein
MGGPRLGCPRLCAVVALQGDIDACLSLPYCGTRMNTRIALATTKKNQLSVSNYYAKMVHYADELAASGAPLCDDELVAYLLAGLYEDFNLVFTVMVARVNPINPSELYAQLLSFEQHTNLQTRTSGGSTPAMIVSHGRGSSGGRGSRGPMHGNGRGHGRGHGPSRGGFSNPSGKSSRTNSASSARPANCASRLGTLPRLAGTVMKRTLLSSNTMPPLLHHPALTTTGTLTMGLRITSPVISTS